MEVTRKLSLKAAQQVPWSSATSLLHKKDGVRRAWTMLPCLAAVFLIGLLGLYVWPSGRSLLGEDPLKAWDPQVKAVGSAAVAYPKPKATSQKQVHIFVCTDEYDLRPLAVLINSTISNAM
jgi:hypothetical protein